jgi:phage tail-like protein
VSETPRNTDRFCTVSHAADTYRRYPGEDLVLYTRVEALKELPGWTLRVGIPSELEVIDSRAQDNAVSRLEVGDEARHVRWHLVGPIPAGACYDYEITTRVAPTQVDLVLDTTATVTVDSPEEDPFSASETQTILVSAKARYLKYLPALYHRDELIGRLLMLFESFWHPVEGQIEQIPLYFDPQMTPPDLLPWLASWLSLVLDEQCPLNRRRDLVQMASSLYRRRGTREGLRDYLKIYTGDQVEVIEHRANNFVLGPEGTLGPGIALGTGNRPHTFTVIVHPQAWDRGADAHQTSGYVQTIKTIIDTEKPAHTGYTLRIEP